MNKSKRFHFVSFSFQIFSAKLISINSLKKKTVKNGLIVSENDLVEYRV